MNGNQTFMLEVKNSNTTLLILPVNRQYYTIEKQVKDNSLATVHFGFSGHLGSPLSCHYIRLATISNLNLIEET